MFVCVRVECFFVLVSVDLSMRSLRVRLCKCVLVCAYVFRSVREHRCLCVCVFVGCAGVCGVRPGRVCVGCVHFCPNRVVRRFVLIRRRRTERSSRTECEGCSGRTQGIPEGSYRIECRATAQRLPRHGVASPYGSRRHIPLEHALMTRAHEYSRPLPFRPPLPPALSVPWFPRARLSARTCTCAFVQVAGTSLVQIDVVRAAWLGYSYSTCGGHMVLAYSRTLPLA